MLKIKASKNIWIIAVFTVIMVLSFSAFSEISIAKENYGTIDGKPILGRGIFEYSRYPSNLEELEEESELIIKGTIQDGKENLAVSENFGYTKTKVLVTEVLKGDTNLLNQVIVYTEPYYEATINGVFGYILSDNYEPAIIDNEYILFLENYVGETEIYKGTYTLEYCETGKYLVNENIKRMRTSVDAYVDGLSNEELNIGPEESKFYRNMYKSVIDKYILKNDVSNVENEKPQENINASENDEESDEKVIKRVSLGENRAINKNGNVFIPVSAAAELLGCKIDWNAYTKTAVMKDNNITVEFPINQSYYILNGNQHNTDNKSEIYNNKTYVPINVINEIFGTVIIYDSDKNAVTLLSRNEILIVKF